MNEVSIRPRPAGPRARAGTTRTTDADYADLQPLLAEYASCAGDDPRRPQLRERLLTGYLPVAHHVARRFRERGVALDDLQQVAALALLKAIDRYDPAFTNDFLGFAVPTMTGEIKRYFRDHTWPLRVPRGLKDLRLTLQHATAELAGSLGRAPRPSELATHLGITVDQVVEGLQAVQAYSPNTLDRPLNSDISTTLGESLGHLDTRLELTEDRHALKPLLERLPERERTILILRFFHDQTQTQIAAVLGISQMHVSRLLSATLHSLREQLQSDTPPGPGDALRDNGTGGRVPRSRSPRLAGPAGADEQRGAWSVAAASDGDGRSDGPDELAADRGAGVRPEVE